VRLAQVEGFPSGGVILLLNRFKRNGEEELLGTDKRTEELARAAAEALAEVKGKDIVILELSEVSAFADYFVIATAESHVQMLAMANQVRDKISQKGLKKIGRSEGRESKSWILMDFGSLIVHIFSKQARDYYSLEQFWGDARSIPWPMDSKA